MAVNLFNQLMYRYVTAFFISYSN